LTRCNDEFLYCDETSNTCKTCSLSRELGCGCTSADDCLSGLTCDLPSGSCVACRAGCTNNCMRQNQMVATVPPSLLCPTFNCYDCRRNAEICKWCNRDGDRTCVALQLPCPSLHAYGDDTVQCGGVLKAETLVDPANLGCIDKTCEGCVFEDASSPDDCKFCGKGGDWVCINNFQECPSGIKDTPQVLCLYRYD
jgi:hypothetical protein